MFRGGRVDSQNDYIWINNGGRVGLQFGGTPLASSGLMSPGMATELARGPRYSGQGLSGANIFQRALVKSKNLPFIGSNKTSVWRIRRWWNIRQEQQVYLERSFRRDRNRKRIRFYN